MLDFPHIEVIRKKEERRKLPGHTCKECEIVSSALKFGQSSILHFIILSVVTAYNLVLIFLCVFVCV